MVGICCRCLWLVSAVGVCGWCLLQVFVVGVCCRCLWLVSAAGVCGWCLLQVRLRSGSGCGTCTVQEGEPETAGAERRRRRADEAATHASSAASKRL